MIKIKTLNAKKYIAAIMTIFMIMPLVSIRPSYAEEIDFASVLNETVKGIYASTPEPTIGYMGGEWAVIGLARSDFKAEDGYFDVYAANVKSILREKNGILDSRKNTEYSRVVLALSALGFDARNFGGYDLIQPLTDFEKTVSQGINGAIWAAIALDCRTFTDGGSEISDVRKRYIDYVLDNQLSDGGWAFGGTDVSDVDLTAMALCALPSAADDERVNGARGRALEYLSAQQTENGTFMSWGSENAESCAQVLIAMCEAGISVDDERFVKNGNSVPDGLMMFYKDGEFVHSLTSGGDSRMSTEQSLCALAALYRKNNGKTALYDMTDISLVDSDDNAEPVGLPQKNEDVKALPKRGEAKFEDIDGADGADKLIALAERGIINGTGGGLFEPYLNITRAEFAAIMVKGLGLPLSGNEIFGDVSGSDWFFDYVAAAYKYGIIKGVSESEFNPNGTLTKEESAVMICRGAALCGLNTDYDDFAVRNVLAAFSDYTKTAEWARPALAFCYDKGILADDDTEINPQSPAQRIEIAVMLYNMLFAAQLIN